MRDLALAHPGSYPATHLDPAVACRSHRSTTTGEAMPAAIILAAGLGTRMRSALPKALHPIAGRPMLNHLLAACEQVFDRIVVVVGPDMPALEAAARPHADGGAGRAARHRPCRPAGSAHAAGLWRRCRGALCRQPADPGRDVAPAGRAARRGRAGAAGHAAGRPRALRPRGDRCRRRGPARGRMGGCGCGRARHRAVQRRRGLRAGRGAVPLAGRGAATTTPRPNTT